MIIPIAIGYGYRIKVEERFMLEQLGKNYLDYQKRTKRIIPMIYWNAPHLIQRPEKQLCSLLEKWWPAIMRGRTRLVGVCAFSSSFLGSSRFHQSGWISSRPPAGNANLNFCQRADWDGKDQSDHRQTLSLGTNCRGSLQCRAGTQKRKCSNYFGTK